MIALAIGLTLLDTASAGGPWRAGESNTRGWQFMSAEERIAHQARIRGFASLEECRRYQRQHHRLMEERARQRGLPLPGGGKDFCAHLVADGTNP